MILLLYPQMMNMNMRSKKYKIRIQSCLSENLEPCSIAAFLKNLNNFMILFKKKALICLSLSSATSLSSSPTSNIFTKTSLSFLPKCAPSMKPLKSDSYSLWFKKKSVSMTSCSGLTRRRSLKEGMIKTWIWSRFRMKLKTRRRVSWSGCTNLPINR